MAALSNEVLESHQREPALIDVMGAVAKNQSDFEKTVSGSTYRGSPYTFGGMRPEVSMRLYGLVREHKPATLVETGVCNGVSTAIMLAALEANGAGSLHSLDLPEYTDTRYKQGTFWDGKQGAVVPKGKLPGWLIPDALRGRWSLVLGRSQEQLAPLLEKLGTIDFFLHDSEHSYECMTFEYQVAWKYLQPGGLLVSDDTSWNSAFQDFARLNSRELNVIDRNMAFMLK